jgi:hypothetical protein
MIEFSYWPQYKHFTITRTRTVHGGEDEVVTIVMSIRQARQFARQVDLQRKEKQ